MTLMRLLVASVWRWNKAIPWRLKPCLYPLKCLQYRLENRINSGYFLFDEVKEMVWSSSLGNGIRETRVHSAV